MIAKSFSFAAFAALSLAHASAAMAGANDFEFQPVSTEIKNGAGAELAVRLKIGLLPGSALAPVFGVQANSIIRMPLLRVRLQADAGRLKQKSDDLFVQYLDLFFKVLLEDWSHRRHKKSFYGLLDIVGGRVGVLSKNRHANNRTDLHYARLSARHSPSP